MITSSPFIIIIAKKIKSNKKIKEENGIPRKSEKHKKSQKTDKIFNRR